VAMLTPRAHGRDPTAVALEMLEQLGAGLRAGGGLQTDCCSDYISPKARPTLELVVM
jgi:hypothetical protein